jgi:hypothetical protein
VPGAVRDAARASHYPRFQIVRAIFSQVISLLRLM